MEASRHNIRFKAAVVAGAVMLAAFMYSCGDSSGVSRHVRDRKAYSLGREHAEMTVASAGDESLLQDRLLEVRARITNINDRLGPQAATDYERGFTDFIRENCDSLAKIIF